MPTRDSIIFTVLHARTLQQDVLAASSFFFSWFGVHPFYTSVFGRALPRDVLCSPPPGVENEQPLKLQET
ncbi:unnamed protein product [Amoebophrya sp. A120]|nr:unnamed protein product [Amoebophrya sp. A120]|eukprot:GSA120T00013196001.1